MTLYISDRLRKILFEIENVSLVAKMLLHPGDYSESLISTDLKINYLDVSESDSSKISYLAQERIQELTTQTAESSESEIFFQYKRRIFARPSSVINRIFKDIRDRDLELFTYAYRSISSKEDFTFKVVDGSDISRYYLLDSYKNQGSSLGNSCMKWENCQKYFGLYIENTGLISMLVMLDNAGMLMGRALLWNKVSCLETNTYYKVMDRIYTINDEQLTFYFKKWAIDNGYIYKHEQKWNNSLFFEKDGSNTLKRMYVNLDHWRFTKFPYMDTFKFLNKTNGTLFNYMEDDFVRTLCGSDGSHYDSDLLAEDSRTHLFYNRGETVSILYNGDIIDKTLKTRAASHNVVWSSINELYIYKEDAEYLEPIDDYIFKNKKLNSQEKIDKALSDVEERKSKNHLVFDMEISRILSRLPEQPIED